MTVIPFPITLFYYFLGRYYNLNLFILACLLCLLQLEYKFHESSNCASHGHFYISSP